MSEPAGATRPTYRLGAVVAVSFFIMFGYGLVVPTLPLFARSFGVAEAGVGLLFTVFAGARLGASLFTGGVLQRLGERYTAGLGAAIVGLSSFAAGFAPNFPALVVLRGLGGFGSAFFLGALMSNILGGVPADRRGRALAAFQGAVVTGFIVGPAFGGLVGRVSLRAPLYAYGIICLLAAPLLVAVMRQGRGEGLDQPAEADAHDGGPPAPRLPAWQRIRPLLDDSAFRGAIAAAFAAFFVVGGVDTLIALSWRDTLHQSRETVGIPFTVIALMGLGPTFHAGKLADSRGRKFTTVPSLAVTIPLICMLGFIRSPLVFVVVTGVLGVAWAYQRPGPSAIVGDVTNDANRPAAVGALRIANDLGAFVGPILVGVSAEFLSRATGYIVASAGALLALVFMIAARETNPKAA